jgi:hypothetical protein
MNREVIEAQRELYTEASQAARAEAARLRASTEEFTRGGEDLKTREIALQERIATEYESLLRALPA